MRDARSHVFRFFGPRFPDAAVVLVGVDDREGSALSASCTCSIPRFYNVPQISQQALDLTQPTRARAGGARNQSDTHLALRALGLDLLRLLALGLLFDHA